MQFKLVDRGALKVHNKSASSSSRLSLVGLHYYDHTNKQSFQVEKHSTLALHGTYLVQLDVLFQVEEAAGIEVIGIHLQSKGNVLFEKYSSKE